MKFRSFCMKSFPFCCLIPLRVFVPRRQSLPSYQRHCFQRPLSHDWNYMSLLLNIVHVSPTENTLSLSSQRRLSFLFDSWWQLLFPQLRSGLWSFEFSLSDQYEVSQTSWIIKNLSARFFERFLDRTKSTRSEAEQSPVILTCTILPRSHLKVCRLLIIEVDPIERRNLGRRHSANVYRTNLRVLIPIHKLPLHGNARRSCAQIVSLVRIGRVFSEMYLRVEKLFKCRRNHRIKHIVVGEVVSSHNRSRCHKFVNWLCHLNFFDPLHCEMGICWFRT